MIEATDTKPTGNDVRCVASLFSSSDKLRFMPNLDRTMSGLAAEGHESSRNRWTFELQ